MYFQLFSAALVALLVSLVLNRVMLAIAPRLGLMDEPGERRIHSQPIPRAGGLAIWVTFLLVMGIGLAAGQLDYGGQLTWSWLAAFAAGSTVLVVAGFLDDKHGLSPWVKLGAHVLAPTVFYVLHPIVTGFFPVGWHWGFDFCLFVGWTVVLINAFNLIDGLDGLCGGLAAVATVALGGLSLLNERFDAAILMFVMAGAIIGFLKYNMNPARIFLGDAGSMVLGFFLATAATEAVGRKAVVGVILLPIAVAGVPLLDVLLAIWRRGARRFAMQLRGEKVVGGIFSADSDHLHHRLLRASGSQRKVAGIMQAIAIVLALLAFLPLFLGERLIGLSIVGFMIIALAGLRNLTRVEMEHTGNAIHLAIKVPGRRRRVAAVLFLYDLFVLTAAGFVAVMMETNLMVRGADPLQLGKFVVIFVTLGSLALLFAKVHQRLWVRATMRDILSLQFWLLIAALLTFVIFSLIDESLEWSALRLAVLIFVFSCLGVCLPRGMLEILRELALDARHRGPSREVGDDPGYGPVVVLGAGDLGALFLEHLKSSAHDLYPKMQVLGFIDETVVLHGRRLRSFRILGGLESVPDLVADRGLKGIVLAIRHPRQELLDQLAELADTHGLKIYRWEVGWGERGSCRLSVVGCRLSVPCARLQKKVLFGQALGPGTPPLNNATMIIKRFEDLEVYQLSLSLQRVVFELTKLFPKEERYSLVDQIRRSSRSVGANIAEAWHKRRYPAHFASKLTDADAECGETRHWLQTGLDCGYLTAAEFEKLMELCLSIGAKLGHMIQNAGNWQPR